MEWYEKIPPFLLDHLPLRMVIMWDLSFIVALVNGMNEARPHDTADAVVLSYRTGMGYYSTIPLFECQVSSQLQIK